MIPKTKACLTTGKTEFWMNAKCIMKICLLFCTHTYTDTYMDA